jgi:flagellar hook-length control protein FliK
MTDAITASPPKSSQSVQNVDKSSVERRESAGTEENAAAEFSAALEAAIEPAQQDAANPDPAAAMAVPSPAIAAATGLDEATELATTGGVPLPFARQAGMVSLRPEARAALQAPSNPPDAAAGPDDPSTAGMSVRDGASGTTGRTDALASGGPAKTFDALLERMGTGSPGGVTQAEAETASPTQPVAADGAPEAARRDRPALLKLDTQLPVHTPRFAEGMSQQVVVLAQHGIHQAQMSLSPPEFGPVDVRITFANDEASVQMAAPTAVAREAIQDALPRLKEMMEQSGVRLNDTGVFAQLPQRDQSAQARQQGEGSQSSRGAQPGDEDEPLPAPIVMRHVGFVDAYA